MSDTLTPHLMDSSVITSLYFDIQEIPSGAVVKDSVTGQWVTLLSDSTQNLALYVSSNGYTFTKAGGTVRAGGWAAIGLAQDSNGALHCTHLYGGGWYYCRITLTRSGGVITGGTLVTSFGLPSVPTGGNGIKCRVVVNDSGTEQVVYWGTGGNSTGTWFVFVARSGLTPAANTDFYSLSGTANAWTSLTSHTQAAGGNWAPYIFNSELLQYGSSGNLFVVTGPSGRADVDDYLSAMYGHDLVGSGANWSENSSAVVGVQSFETMVGVGDAKAGVAYFPYTYRLNGSSNVQIRVARVATDGTVTASIASDLSFGANGSEVSAHLGVMASGNLLVAGVSVDPTPNNSRVMYSEYDGSSWTTIAELSVAALQGGYMLPSRSGRDGATLIIAAPATPYTSTLYIGSVDAAPSVPPTDYNWTVAAGSVSITAGAVGWAWSGEPPSVTAEGSNESGTANQTSFAAATGSPQSGERTIIVVTRDSTTGNADFSSTPIGAKWKLISNTAQDTDTTSLRCIAIYADCDGTEGATVAFTTPVGEAWVGHYFRLAAGTFDPATAPAVAVNGSAAANNDPAALTPSWGAANNLWICTLAQDANSTAPSVYPSGYTTGQGTLRSTNTTTGDRTRLTWCRKTANAASDDPSAFTHAAAATVAYTLAVRPYVAAGSASTGTLAESTAGALVEVAAAGQSQSGSCVAVVAGSCAELAVTAQSQAATAQQSSSAGPHTEASVFAALAGASVVQSGAGVLGETAAGVQTATAMLAALPVGSSVDVATGSQTATSTVSQLSSGAIVAAMSGAQTGRAVVAALAPSTIVQLLLLDASSTSFVVSIVEATHGACVQSLGGTLQASGGIADSVHGNCSVVALLHEQASSDVEQEGGGFCEVPWLAHQTAYCVAIEQGSGSNIESLDAAAFAGIYLADVAESSQGHVFQLVDCGQTARAQLDQSPAAFVIERIAGYFGFISVAPLIGSGRWTLADTNTGAVEFDNMLIHVGDRKVIHVTDLPGGASDVHFYLVGPEGPLSADREFQLGVDNDEVFQRNMEATAFDFITPKLMLPGVYEISYLTEYGPSKPRIAFTVFDIVSERERADL